MSQKVAYVTGGMGGIGTAICQRLHKDGFKVIAGCGPTRDFNKWLAEQKALGYSFHASVGNVADWDSTVEAFSKAKAEHGSIDVLVNNAGITRDRMFLKMSREDWDAVIDAEMARRKLLEDTPIPSTNEEPVLFDTAEIPWWAWVRRFHLPEAEKLNGRAAMVGYFLALFVDQLTGAGLLDQQNSFLGKVALHIAVFGILLIRSTSDIESFKNLIDEATFYDKQWQATWEGQERPSESEN